MKTGDIEIKMFGERQCGEDLVQVMVEDGIGSGNSEYCRISMTFQNTGQPVTYSVEQHDGKPTVRFAVTGEWELNAMVKALEWTIARIKAGR